MIHKRPSSRTGYVLVTFELPSDLWIESASVVGDFNNWNPLAHPLKQHNSGDAAWSVTLELPVGREYQFRYLTNSGDWLNEWHADKYVPNEHGSDNSVVVT